MLPMSAMTLVYTPWVGEARRSKAARYYCVLYPKGTPATPSVQLEELDLGEHR